MSIVPPFTWEAIMEAAKVDELIKVLGLARQEARRPVVVARADRGHTELSARSLTDPADGSDSTSTRTDSRRSRVGR